MKPGLKKALIQRGMPKKRKQIKAKELADSLGMTAEQMHDYFGMIEAK